VKSTPLLRVGLLLGVGGLVVASVRSYRMAVDHARAVAYGRDVRQLTAIDARLSQELLRSRAGLSTHYDTIVRNVQELRDLVNGLAVVPAFLQTAEVVDVRARLGTMSGLVDEKENIIESFKSNNAVLRNSQRFLPVAARALSERTPPRLDVDQRLHLLLSTLMQLDNARDREVSVNVKTAIDALRAWAPADPSSEQDLAKDIAVLLQHADIVAERKPILDALVDNALSVPLSEASAELEDVYSSYYRNALAGEDERQKLLFVAAGVVVVLGLIEVILRLRQGRAALERATLELKSANRALATEREKERELGELKTRFVAMVAHEFRNPVAAILSSSELLERYGEKWDGARRLNHFEGIRGAAMSLTQLLDEILLIGRAEAGLLRPHPSPINLQRLCEELVASLTQTLGETHRVRRSFTGDADVVLDERLLRHLLSNLLENAIKYSPGAREVELSVDANGPEIRFTVKDHGIGIPQEDLPDLFSTFHRGANVGRIRGSGLGLAVVKHVVEAQDGRVDVNSEVGRGTEFVVVLPKPGAAPDSAPSSPDAQLEAS
jgi:signal transduction histidine kinase